MNCQALAPGPPMGCPYIAVGMHRARESAIGLPSSLTSAAWMLGFVTPLSVSKNFTCLALRVSMSVSAPLWRSLGPRTATGGSDRYGSARRMGHRTASWGRVTARIRPSLAS